MHKLFVYYALTGKYPWDDIESPLRFSEITLKNDLVAFSLLVIATHIVYLANNMLSDELNNYLATVVSEISEPEIRDRLQSILLDCLPWEPLEDPHLEDNE